MLKTVISALSLAAAVAGGIAVTPAMAQSGYRYSERYEGDDGSYYRSESYRGYHDRDDEDYDGERYERRDVEYAPRGYYRDGYYREGPRYAPRHRYARCGSGTTGTIVGAALGGLLGREIGRGGYYDRPSTTGLILGAGAGALAGRAIDQDGCR